jgi:hypothetical protein
MGDLPKWKKCKDLLSGEKCEDFFKMVKNVKDFSKWSYFNGRPA